MPIQKPITNWAKAILFDFDYTLGDSSEAIIECVNYALEKVGAPTANPKAIKQTIGLPLETIFSRFAPGKIPEAVDFFLQHADEIMVGKTTLYPGLVDILLRIHDRTDLKMAVISTKNNSRIVSILQKFDLDKIFHTIVGGDDIARPKPAPDATLLALQKIGCSANEAAVLGDSVMDAGTAKAAGVMFIGVTTGTTTEEKLFENGAVAVYASVVHALQDLLGTEDNESLRNTKNAGYIYTSPEAVRKEIEISYYKSSGPGGQKKNKTSSSVRIKHLPTGIIVVAMENRSQHKNRELAWQRLIDKLERLNKKPKPRIPTKLPASAKQSRLKNKKATSIKKQLRRPPQIDD